MAKRGRRPQALYITGWKEVVEGVRQVVIARDHQGNPAVWRLYPTGQGSPYFGTVRAGDLASERRAVGKFLAWQAEQDGPVQIELEPNTPPEVREMRAEVEEVLAEIADELGDTQFHDKPMNWKQWIVTPDGEEIHHGPTRHNLHEFFDGMKFVLNDPKLRQAAATATGWPLHRLDSLPEPEPSRSLQHCVNVFWKHSEAGRQWKLTVRRMWKEFRQVCRVKTLRELRQRHLLKYRDYVIKKAQTRSYRDMHFRAIIAVLNFSLKRGESGEDIPRILLWAKVLVPPKEKRSKQNSRPITPQEFGGLLRHATQQQRAFLLCSLNFCMYAQEALRLLWSELDLDRQTLVTSRHKTGCIRVAVLWESTVAALRALPRTGLPEVFVSQHGKPFTKEGQHRQYRLLREAAGLAHVQFSWIRDAAYTTAIEGGADIVHAKLLAGHEIGGDADAYVARKPTMVRDATDAIWAAYGQEIQEALTIPPAPPIKHRGNAKSLRHRPRPPGEAEDSST